MHPEYREGHQPYDIYIKDPEHVRRIKKQWTAIPPQEFHVLADFDRTLTQGIVEGQASASIIAQIRNGNYLSAEYSAAAHALFDQYHPMEVDHTIPLEQREAAMREWWIKHFELLIESGLSKPLIEQIAKERPLVFREGTRDLIADLRAHAVPLVILSAAPGDMIHAYLREEGIADETVRIIATLYEFDTNGNALRVKEPIIHSLNKHEIMIDADGSNTDIHARPNVLLLGDSIGDVGMIDGFDYTTLLKVGFLNMDIDKRKNAYMDAFDIVIAHDGPMTPVRELLHQTIFS